MSVGTLLASLSATFGADSANKSLGYYPGESAGHEERRYPHVQQPRDRARRVGRVDRREYQRAGDSGSHRDLGGLSIADLADHHDVWILSQHRPQGVCKP